LGIFRQNWLKIIVARQNRPFPIFAGRSKKDAFSPEKPFRNLEKSGFKPNSCDRAKFVK